MPAMLLCRLMFAGMDLGCPPRFCGRPGCPDARR